MLRNRILFNLLWIFILFFSACSSMKKVEVKSIANIPDVKLRNLLRSNELKYDKIYLKKAGFTVQTNSDKKSFKGSIVIQRDSLIITSIFAPMGIELVRVKFDLDSIFVLDKHNKNVLKSDYNYFDRKYGVEIDFNMLQAMLTNTLFTYPLRNDFYEDLKKYKHTLSDSCYAFKSVKTKKIERKTKRNANDLVVHEINIHPELFRIFDVFIKDFQNNQTLSVKYQKFTNFDGVLFPGFINLNASQGNSKIYINLKINSVEINDGGSLYFNIPKKYEERSL